MERKKRKNWVLPVILVIAVTFSNVCPVTAAELPAQAVLAKADESKKALDSGEQKDKEVYSTEINDEDRVEKVTRATSSNAQKPETEDEELEDEEFEDVELEDEELKDEELEDEELKNEELEYKDLENEDLGDGELEDKDLEDEDLGDEENNEDVLKDKTPEDEKSEDLVWVWSDKAPVLMEAEEGDDLSSQFFGMTRASGICPTYEEAYNAMIGMKDDYYEGMPWTNFQPYGSEGDLPYYRFQGGPVKGASLGVGCAAFVFELSDAAFGDLPARTIDKGGFAYEDVKVGDILRVNNSHFVIVLRVASSGVTVAEGNYNKSVHWGRTLSKSEVLNANFIVTRYPSGYSEDQDADEVAYSGTEGSLLSWTLTNGGTLTISGKGAMPDYTNPDNTKSARPTWEAHADKINQVIIEDGVESIGSYAFYKSLAMSVQIPETVASINEAAFGASNLMEITVPGSVKVIGDEAFYNCKNLKSATFYEGVQSIGVNAFHQCGIAYLDFPASITSVGAGAFMECDKLVRVRFAPGEQKVSLGDNLFTKCWSLSDVTLPVNVDKISSGMFANCLALTYLYIPREVIVYEAGVDPDSPFFGCDKLKTIDFGGTESEWDANGGPLALNRAGLTGKVTVNFNVAFDDPFADIPNDPGEFVPCDHVDKDGDERCDICGLDLSNDPSEPEEPGDDKEEPGDDKEEPGKPGDSEEGDKDPVKPDVPDNNQKPGGIENGGNNSGGSSGGNSSGSSGSSGSDSSGSSSSGSSSQGSSSSTSESVNKVVSANETTNAAGEKVETVKWSDGTVVVTTTDTTGAKKLEVELPKQMSETARREDKVMTLPIDPIPVTNDITNATSITINTDKGNVQSAANPATASTKPVKVLVPVTTSGAGVVAVLVNPDGSTQVIEDSTLIEGGMVVPVVNGDTVKIVDMSREFTDVPADVWYEDAVDFVTARDLFYGVTETTFDPAAYMTCATLVTALARLEGLDTKAGTTWYEEGMSWAVTSGVMDAGVNPESTATSDLIQIYEKYFNVTINDELPTTLTRAEAAQMLLNLKRCRP